MRASRGGMVKEMLGRDGDKDVALLAIVIAAAGTCHKVIQLLVVTCFHRCSIRIRFFRFAQQT